MQSNRTPQSAHVQRVSQRSPDSIATTNCTRSRPCPREVSPKYVMANNLTRDDKNLQKEKIPYVVYMELRNDLEFTRKQLIDA